MEPATKRDHQLALVESIYRLLVTRANGKTVEDDPFVDHRLEALKDPELAPLLPGWLREVRTPRDFQIYSANRFEGAGQAKEYLRREFAPIFGFLEGIEVTRDTSPIRGAVWSGRSYHYPGTERPTAPADDAYVPGNKVFLVHGHDKSARNAVEAYLRRMGLQPIVLSDVPSASRTIIEKLEAFDDVDYAVIILTPDDHGGSQKTPETLQPRARQNVVLELGYFIGRLGRPYVAALLVGDIEVPSDVRGVAYIPFNESSDEWQTLLLRELRQAQMPVNLDGI